MANPALSEKLFGRISSIEDTSKMTITGTINKTGLLFLLVVVGANLGWNTSSPILMIGSMITALVLSLLIIFGPQRASYLSQPYALTEGVVLGAVSSMYAAQYPGLVSNAMILTLSCLFLMLALYRFQIIKVNDRTRSMIMVATMAIGLTYFISMILGFFGVHVPMIHDASPMGIGFSLLVVGVAAFNLLLDFDFIEQASLRGSPKFMEWYGGFALLVTIVWLYLEMLRLLSKLNKR